MTVLVICLALGGFAIVNSKVGILEPAPPQAPTEPASEDWVHGHQGMEGSSVHANVPPRSPQHMAVDELLEGDPRRIALSIEELQWLQRHAYPSDREFALVATMDTRPLRGNKDPRQSTLQGLALLQQGEPGAGAALLLGAGAMGAIYAYEEGAIADHALMEQRLGKSMDLDDVLRARLEVAKVLGDHRAEWLMAKHLPSYPMPERAEHVQRHATEFLRQLGQEGQLTGMSVPGPDPRPNRDQWIRLQELVDHGASRSVEVYRLE